MIDEPEFGWFVAVGKVSSVQVVPESTVVKNECEAVTNTGEMVLPSELVIAVV